MRMAWQRRLSKCWGNRRFGFNSVKLGFQYAVAVIVVAASVSASAADLAILRNGNSIRHERRQTVGAVTRLYLGDTASGYIEIPNDQIERFEKDTAPDPVPVKAQAALRNTAPPVAAASLPSHATVNPVNLNQVVSGAGERHQIDPDFINSVIRAESGFNSRAISKKGAQGLMQLMPQTASQLGVANSFDPNANVEGGTKYLRELLEKYNFDVVKALAAYNAGPKRVDQYRGVPPYYETHAYIARIIRDFNRRKLAENPALGRKPTAHSSRAVTSKAAASKRRSNQSSAAATASLPQNPQTVSR
jgi:soluble lytic murein transglycosylase-like protein